MDKMDKILQKCKIEFFKKFYSLKQYEKFCNACCLNASDRASKYDYAKVLEFDYYNSIKYEMKKAKLI